MRETPGVPGSNRCGSILKCWRILRGCMSEVRVNHDPPSFMPFESFTVPVLFFFRSACHLRRKLQCLYCGSLNFKMPSRIHACEIYHKMNSRGEKQTQATTRSKAPAGTGGACYVLAKVEQKEQKKAAIALPSFPGDHEAEFVMAPRMFL